MINLINQQAIVFPRGKIDGEKSHGFWHVKTSAFRHAVFDTRAMRLLTSAHPIKPAINGASSHFGRQLICLLLSPQIKSYLAATGQSQPPMPDVSAQFEGAGK
ncbi:hypothetical protein IVG45_05910 [Methylomonas sp. LL1]|uniref:hypothetical protein n=1 Tax=Methylomonas sp. LL1 TaxID=2785785 RepID=UPI0018C38375|nr:hypothetical protein [Methylomonas sp. LL1]QPK64501.1 hypothetical protein IVG45_05910 [Methylomonas sp. LL1]